MTKSDNAKGAFDKRRRLRVILLPYPFSDLQDSGSKTSLKSNCHSSEITDSGTTVNAFVPLLARLLPVTNTSLVHSIYLILPAPLQKIPTSIAPAQLTLRSPPHLITTTFDHSLVSRWTQAMASSSYCSSCSPSSTVSSTPHLVSFRPPSRDSRLTFEQ